MANSDAMALFAAQRGIETGLAMKGAFDSQAMARAQSANMERQMSEIEARSKMQLQNIYQQSDKVVATQQAAFITGGVKLSGSAMSVISDTLNDAAQAAYIRQRETDYDLMSLSIEKAGYDQMASNESLLLNLGVAGVNGVASLALDKYKYDRATTKERGATKIGGGGPMATGSNGGAGITSSNGSSGLGDAYA